MLTFVLWTVYIATGLAALVWLTLVCVVLASIKSNWHRTAQGNLPPPDKAAERSWSQRYFERAIGRK
jgi:hypothetical protein